uniref:Uncharacterized protein n=1 Tax=Candidatus Kentrum sp. UNK TaxID=2126344 RepID=A0A451AA97_9GAMM|nr:MAG: hypothetical protein BECKUNK1418G_GA0071005_102821 [Candidatus Kentron sp. UNK]VFK70668.1 MAG: hypothetical protein BECKUNK1418H_GA0071006_103521 [Candidatus Kentron sp. UNK]
MALDPVPASAGMTYPCRDDGIVEFGFGFDFQLGVKISDSCFRDTASLELDAFVKPSGKQINYEAVKAIFADDLP